jgi:hypothetical protein
MSAMAEQQWDAAGDLRVIAPSTKAIRVFMLLLGFPTALGCLITVISLANGVRTLATSRGLDTGLVLLLLGGLFLLGMWLWSANVRLLIGRGTVGYRNILRRSRFWSRGEIGGIVDMAINYGRTSQPQRGFYFFGLNGRKLFVLTPRVWHANDLRDFIDATGVEVDHRDAPVPAKAVRREFPNAFGWDTEHVTMATLITMTAAVVVVIGGYMLVSTLFHP